MKCEGLTSLDENSGEAEEDALPRCGCHYCYYLDRTRDGGPCDSCRSGAHQG